MPNASARQLVAGESRTIAYVVLDAANPFFTDVARGIDEVASGRDLSLFLCDSDQDAGREDRYLDRLTELRVRGVLITAIDDANPRLSATAPTRHPGRPRRPCPGRRWRMVLGRRR